MWGVIREIELLSQTARLILTQRGWFHTRNMQLAEKLKEEGWQPASPLQGKKRIGMRNPNCHLEKLHQELNLWHCPKKTSGSRWFSRILALGQLLGIPGMAQWPQLGKMNPSRALRNLLGQWGWELMKELPLSISLMSNGEMMTLCLCSMTRMSPSPRHQLLPWPQFRHVKKKTKLFPCSNHHFGKSLAFESQSLNVYRRQLQHASNLTIMMQN